MKIAIIGGGISGLSASLILNQKHEVHLFESEPRLGGHAHTVNLRSNKEQTLPLDTGFLVYNTLTYPHFTKFLDYLSVKTAPSQMTLSIKAENGIEWCGTNLKTIFAQKRNLLRLSFLRMLYDALRFNRNAEKNLRLSREKNWTLEELLKNEKYSEDFQKLYLLPMTGAIWSMSFEKSLQFPAETFLTFCINHHLLQINDRPTWRTIEGGSINYVTKVHERLNHVHFSTPVLQVREEKGQLILSTSGSEFSFDKVVFATHAPTTRKLIESHFPDMAQELSSLKVTSNKVHLHEDSSIMPKNKICWSAWNVESRNSVHDKSEIGLTYYINKLQPLNTDKNYFITLNSHRPLNHLHQTFIYDHPQFDFDAIKTQNRLSLLQGKRNLYFAGAWTRYGFHEDGILSAIQVAELMGVKAPWT